MKAKTTFVALLIIAFAIQAEEPEPVELVGVARDRVTLHGLSDEGTPFRLIDLPLPRRNTQRIRIARQDADPPASYRVQFSGGWHQVARTATLAHPTWIVVSVSPQEPELVVFETEKFPKRALDIMFARVIDYKNLEHRLAIIHFYLQAKRPKDALRELARIEEDFPKFDSAAVREMIEDSD